MTRFSDINGPTESNPTFGREKSGCWVSPVVGLILILLAGAIAVGVGFLVHLLGPGASLTCQCGEVSGTDGASDVTWSRCLELARASDQCLVSPNCPALCDDVTNGPSNTPDRTTPSVPTRPTDVRLPHHLIPLHYDVELWPHLYSGNPSSFFFNGSVRIYLNCTEATDVITVHANELDIDEASLKVEMLASMNAMGQLVRWASWEIDSARQFFKLYTEEMMQVGKLYAVEMKFTGPLAQDLKGLYASSYQRDNETIWLATTQMQPTDARKTFPCLDEPALKATFNVTLVRKFNMTSLANTEIARTENKGDDWIADYYKKTVKMPTYLLAFIICDFQSKENFTSSGTKFRVWARPNAMEHVDYALDVGVRILEYFEQYFDIEFPLEKQDMIAVPDFAAGAMENWGLIVYRETAMLYDPQVSSSSNKQRVAVVVSHELAHQWFGNLVSPSWWDDLWLNEGFASYVEYLGVAHVEPDWQMDHQILVDDVHDVFQLDQLSTSHPIYVPVGHPDEINEIFDRISYAKGASIIRMMNNFLGESTFQRGLTRYLRRHSYGNAHHRDLWRALAEQAALDGLEIDVSAIMDTWVLQMGYPVITVNRDEMYHDIAQVTQKHFLIDPSTTPDKKYPSPFDYKWAVPLTYTLSSSPNWTNPAYKLMNREDIQLVGLDSSADWILANIDQYGYYRVNYDSDNWQALIRQLEEDHSVIPTKNRAQILDDLFNLGRAGEVPQVLALQATNYLTNETEYIPWESARVNLNYVDSMFQQSADYGLFQAYMLRQATALYTRVSGWNIDETEPLLQRYLRLTALSMACSYGNKACLDTALEKYQKWMQDPVANSIPADLKNVVYCYGVNRGGVAEWEFAYEQYKLANVATEKSKLLYALACTDVPWLLTKYMDLTWSDIRRQDAVYVLGYISSNPIGRALVWDGVRDRWTDIIDRYGASFFALSRLVDTMTASFNTPFKLKEMEAFITENQAILGSGVRAFAQAVEKVQSNIAWMADNKQAISTWLTSVVAS